MIIRDDEAANIFSKMASRGYGVNRRKLQSTLLANSLQRDSSYLVRRFLVSDRRVASNPDYMSQTTQQLYAINHLFGRSKPRNFCLYLGKGRTFNRKYHISRQIFRKLIKTGALLGLQKA